MGKTNQINLKFGALNIATMRVVLLTNCMVESLRHLKSQLGYLVLMADDEGP